MGLTSMEAIRPSAWVGTWALVWEPCRRFHEPFRSLDITDTAQPVFAEVQSAHADLLVRHKRVTAAYDGFDKKVFDYCKKGRPRPLPISPERSAQSRPVLAPRAVWRLRYKTENRPSSSSTEVFEVHSSCSVDGTLAVVLGGE